MGFSWALSGRVDVKRLAEFKKATIDPARFDDWPDDWGEPGCDTGAMTASEVIDAYAQADAGAIEWKSDGVSLRAVFSNDSHLWLTYRSHLVAAIRAASDFGGTSDVAITGYIDGGPDSVFRVVARADGTSELEVLTARAAKPIAQKIYDDVQPLIDAMLASLRKPVPRDPQIAKTKARALLRPVGGPKNAAAVVAALRKIAPKSPSVHDRNKLAAHPDVRRLCESKSRDVFAAARAKLDELTAGRKLDRLKNDEHMYVYALALVLEAGAKDEDWDVLFRIWSESPGFVLLDGARIQRHGDRGRKWIAGYFGKNAKNEYARRLQPPAAHALLSLDEAGARAALAKLVDKKRMSDDDAWAAQSMIGLLRETKASPAWTKILTAAATARSAIAGEALAVLAQWKVPKTAKIVVEAIGVSLSLDDACTYLETLRDASVLPALRKRLKALGPKERGARNRVEQCIAALGG